MIRCRGLIVDIGGRAVLDGLDLDLGGAGTLCALVGINGSGKSTLLRVAAGWIAPAAGQALLDDQPLHRLDPRQRARRIAWLAQRSELDAPFTVAEVLAQAGYAADRTIDIAGIAADCGLDHLLDRPFTALSGGERQRVLLARCLAQRADHLLGDEPTTHLDPAATAAVVALLRRTAAQGTGVVVATHDPALILAADRIIALRDGRIGVDVGAAQANAAVFNRIYGTTVPWAPR